MIPGGLGQGLLINAAGSDSESLAPPRRRKRLFLFLVLVFLLGVADVISDVTLIVLTFTRDATSRVTNRIGFGNHEEFHNVVINNVSTLAECSCSGFCYFSPPIENFQYVCPSRQMHIQLRVVDTRSAVVYSCEREEECLPNLFPSPFIAVIVCAILGEIWGIAAVCLQRQPRDDSLLGAARTSLIGLLWLLIVLVRDSSYRRALLYTNVKSMPVSFAVIFILSGIVRNFASTYYASSQLGDVGGLSTEFYAISVAFSFLTSYCAFLIIVLRQSFQPLKRTKDDHMFYPLLFSEMLLFMIGCGYLGLRGTWAAASTLKLSEFTVLSVVALIILVVIPVLIVSIGACLWIKKCVPDPRRAYCVLATAMFFGFICQWFLFLVLPEFLQD